MFSLPATGRLFEETRANNFRWFGSGRYIKQHSATGPGAESGTESGAGSAGSTSSTASTGCKSKRGCPAEQW